jgi:hypothetical protein
MIFARSYILVSTFSVPVLPLSTQLIENPPSTFPPNE